MSSLAPVAEIHAVEADPRPPRRWPALLIVAIGALLYLSIFLFVLAPDSIEAMPVFMAYMMGPAAMTAVLGAWWLLLGPASWRTRFATTGLAIAVVLAAGLAADSSVRNFMTFKGIPATAALVTLFLCAFWWLRAGVLIGAALAIGIVTLLPWTLIRCSEGVTGSFEMDPSWRWRPSAEELATAFDQGKQGTATAREPAPTVSEADWPGFRGARRDGVVAGLVNLGDWSTPPRELWRRPVGPGWSSLCVVGDRLYTQEQRGDDELVVCYRVATGDLLWSHADQVRYNDAMSGTGPRATPTYHEGKLYTFGGTGILNCLDAMTGKLLWKADVKQTSEDTAPPFGFATSPLVIGDKVILQPGAPKGYRVLAFEAATGKEVWKIGSASASYCSSQLSTLAGVPQLLIYNSDGLFGHDPTTGYELWSYSWTVDNTGASVIQPMVLPDDRIVLGGGRIGIGTRCIKPTLNGSTWSVEDVWRITFSPGFNDMERFGDYLYGLEGGRLVCLEAATGQRKWKDGRYGTGQLLRVGDRLLILSETGKLAQVNPSPDGWQELVQIPALSDKTWNHPVVAQGKLFVRNGREMVCYQLTP